MEHPVQNERQTQCLPKIEHISVSAVAVIAVYVAAQILADIGSLKVALVATLSVDCGTFIYPITFTVRDMIHKKLGKKTACTVIIACAIINLVMALYFALITLLPSDPTWQLQEAWAQILGPVWRIVAASISAEVISELLDTEMYQLWVNKFGTKHQWGRVLASNAVSVPVDSAVFAIIAFVGTMPFATVLSIILANVLVKGAVTLASIPLIYTVKNDSASVS